MGIFDFLGDLSSKRSKELGLGGLQSLLGTRGAAQAGAIGDEMIGITNKDSLPGYFNEQTREYVPWYVDLFDGGGLNKAGGQAQEEAAKSGAAGVTPGGAPMAQPGLLANNQLSDMERANRSRASQMTPSLGSQLSDMEMANRSRVGIDPRTPELPRVREIQNNRYSNLIKLDGGELLRTDTNRLDFYNRNMKYRENLRDNPPNIAMPEEPIVPSLPDMFSSDPAQVGSQVIPASGGNMAINIPAAQNRDQMIANQIDLQQLNEMQAHPLYQNFAQSPFGEGDKKYYPVEFFKYLQATGG